MGAFGKLREKLFGERTDEFFDESPEDYVEINNPELGSRAKIIVKPFIIHDFQDIKQPIDSLREGYTIALINIRPLKEIDNAEEVYKIVGNIMLSKKKEDLKKELISKKGIIDIRIKSLEKEESKTREKANILQKEVIGEIENDRR